MASKGFEQLLSAVKGAAGAANPAVLPALGVGAGVAGTALLANALMNKVGEQRQLEGKTLLGQGPAGDFDTMEAILKLQQRGAMLAPEIAQALVKPTNELENARLQRALQQNQQLGQITGALARQKYGFQLAGGAQQLGGNVLNSMMANPNPYATSAMGNMVNLSL